MIRRSSRAEKSPTTSLPGERGHVRAPGTHGEGGDRSAGATTGADAHHYLDMQADSPSFSLTAQELVIILVGRYERRWSA